jgi:diacylglycerol kinase family enzyme
VDRPLCLIVNPAAGNGRSVRLLPHVTGVLEQAGAEHRVVESASLGHAQDLAAEAAEHGEAVVAVGGDGLAGALAGIAAAGGRFTRYPDPQGAAYSGAIYGIIPAGRGNDLARVLGIPADPREAARVLAAGRHRQVDLIGVGTPGQPETVVAGSVYAGIPAVAGDIANASHLLPGWLVYHVAALRALARWKPVTFSVSIIGPAGDPGDPSQAQTRSGDGQEAGETVSLARRTTSSTHKFDGYAVIVANNPYFGAGMQVAPPALIDDGTLDIVLMRQAPKLTFVRALMKIKDGSHIALPQVDLTRGVTVTLTMSRDLPAAADGEPLACASPLASGTSLEIRALPAALRVLVPAI